MKRSILYLFGLLLSFNAASQTDSCLLRISLLTCAPGEALYSTFGHTAIRVTRQANETGPAGDYVFNYGSFEFGPDFYMKFIRGKLLYFLSIEDWESFRYQYYMENRSVKEQVLNLDCPEKEKLFAALLENAKEENRYYRYDFLVDNCTTRAGDMITAHSDTAVAFKNILPSPPPSYRDLLHTYLDLGDQNWSKLGIDILLGRSLDFPVSNQEAMFLPDYLLKGMDSALVNGRPLVQPAKTIMERPSTVGDTSILTPFVVFTALLLLTIALALFLKRPYEQFFRVFDRILFLLLGLAGFLLLFMWFGTDHLVCRNNFNLVWAIPFHAIMIFFPVHSPIARYYFSFITWLTVTIMLLWFFLPQEMNNALLPVLALILFRSWKRSKMVNDARRKDPARR